MKRNLVPLLAIAFMVALAATGIFYGLFVGQLRDGEAQAARQSIVVAARSLDRGAKLKKDDLRLMPWAGAAPPGAMHAVADAVGKTVYRVTLENEPITGSQTAPERMAGMGAIPKGLRAMSVRVSESSGLLPFLHAGQRVDLQVVSLRRGEPAARTLLSNVEVLSVNAVEGTNAQASLNVLVAPSDADRLALADSTAKVRLLLRNQIDAEAATRMPPVESAALWNDRRSARPVFRAASAIDQSRLHLEVKFSQPSPGLLAQHEALLTAAPAGHDLQIAALRPGIDAAPLFLTHGVLKHVSLPIAAKRIATFEPSANANAGCAACRVGLRIEALQIQAGAVKLRLYPEMHSPFPRGAETRSYQLDLDLADGQTGVLAGSYGASLGEQHGWMIAVTPRLSRATASPAGS